MTWVVATGVWNDAGVWADGSVWQDIAGTSLVPVDVATGAPTLGIPVLSIIVNLTPVGIAAGSPTLGVPRLRAYAPWPFKPMVDSTESLSWSTDVLRSAESEMRISLRPARQTLTYSYNLRDPQNAKMEGLARHFPMSEWLVPVWHEGTSVAGLGAADTVLSVDTDADYRAGGFAMIWVNCDTAIIRQIESVGAGSITLASPVGSVIASARVMPCVFAWLTESGVAINRIQPGVTSATVSFLSRETAPEGVTPWPQYLGLDLVKKCGVVEPLAGSYVPSVAFIDNDLGPVAREALRTPQDVRYVMSWRLRETLWQRRLWLHFIRGRDRAFWLRDWSADLELQAAITSAATSILVAPALPVPAAYVGRHILIGDIARQITAAVQDGANHRLTIAATGAALPAATRVGFLRKVRLDTDIIEVAHRHDFYAALRLPLIEVPE